MKAITDFLPIILFFIVYNWLFALACVLSHFIGNTPLIKRIIRGGLSLPDTIWTKLNVIWASFFIVQGALNLFVMYNFDTDTWVNFKLFGMLGMTLLFIVAQGLYLMKYLENPLPTSNKDP